MACNCHRSDNRPCRCPLHVRDTYESYINPETDLPVFSIRNILEGHYKKYNEVAFDHTSRSDSTLVFSDLSGNHTAPKGLLDIVSCFYWFRKYHLARADTLVPGEALRDDHMVCRRTLPYRPEIHGNGDS